MEGNLKMGRSKQVPIPKQELRARQYRRPGSMPEVVDELRRIFSGHLRTRSLKNMFFKKNRFLCVSPKTDFL